MAGHGVLVATPVIAAIGVAVLAALRVFMSFVRLMERTVRVSIAQVEFKNGTYVSILSVDS